MRRLILLLFVAFVSANFGGVLDLVAPDRCSASESERGTVDCGCPSVCVRCHGSRVVNPVPAPAVSAVVSAEAEWLPLSDGIPQPIPRDILHIPKAALL